MTTNTSIYDDINSAEELINHVIAHGLDITLNAKNRAADIFGRTSMEELTRLANGKHSDKFYFIAFSIWNWLDAVCFYNTYTLKINDVRREQEKEIADLKEQLRIRTENYEYYKGLYDDCNMCCKDVEAKLQASEDARKACRAEVIELKAKLYDLMMQEQ